MAATAKDWNDLANAIDAWGINDAGLHAVASQIRLMARPEWQSVESADHEFALRHGVTMEHARAVREAEAKRRYAELMAMPAMMVFDRDQL